MITVKIIHNSNTFRKIDDWLKERNIPLSLGPNVDEIMIQRLLQLADLRVEKGKLGNKECDVFYFENLEDAMLFKLTWG